MDKRESERLGKAPFGEGDVVPRDPGLWSSAALADAWPAPRPPAPRARWRRRRLPAAPRQRPGGSRQPRASGSCQRRKGPQQALTKGSPWSLAGTVCPPGGLSLMVKPDRQKRWTAPGALQGPGRASRTGCRPPSGPPRALPPAPPVRISPSSRSVEGSPGQWVGCCWGYGGCSSLGPPSSVWALSSLSPGGRKQEAPARGC